MVEDQELIDFFIKLCNDHAFDFIEMNKDFNAKVYHDFCEIYGAGYNWGHLFDLKIKFTTILGTTIELIHESDSRYREDYGCWIVNGKLIKRNYDL